MKLLNHKKNTACRLEGLEFGEDFYKEKETLDAIMNQVARVVSEWARSGTIEGFSAQYVKFKAGHCESVGLNKDVRPDGFKWERRDADTLSLRQINYHPEISEIISAHGDPKDMNLPRVQEVIWKVMENFKSFFKKNKRPPKNIQTKTNKALNFKDATIKIDHENMVIYAASIYKDPNGEKKWIKVPYKKDVYSNGQFTKEKCGGNFSFDWEDFFVAAVTEEEEYPIPEVIIGMDTNKKDSEWMRLSSVDGKWSKSVGKIEKIKRLQKLAQQDNSDLFKKKTGNSAFRRKIHERKERRERAFGFAVREEVSKLIDEIQDEFKGRTIAIALDTVAINNSNSFGQEKIREAAILECQRRLIPYVLVPSPHTTAYCSKCGYKYGKRCKKLNTYTCKCCGYTNANADSHAAQNHAIFGEYLFKKIPYICPHESFTVVLDKSDPLYNISGGNGKDVKKIRFKSLKETILDDKFFK